MEKEDQFVGKKEIAIGHEYCLFEKKWLQVQRKAKRPSITGLNIAAKFAGEGAKVCYGRRRPFHERFRTDF